MEDIYWKVHKDNLKYVDGITKYQLDVWLKMLKDSDMDYIYIAYNKKPLNERSDNNLGFMPYNSKDSIEYFKNNKFKYKGEFFSKKETRFKKLQKLQNEKINESTL